VDFSDTEKIKILVHVLKKYASLFNWTSQVDRDGRITDVNKWVGEGNGYDLARQTLDLIGRGNESTSKK
jgi:hypothetical protein